MTYVKQKKTQKLFMKTKRNRKEQNVMRSYVIDVSNPEERKETNKTVENLLEEYKGLLLKKQEYIDNYYNVCFFLCCFSFIVLIVLFIISINFFAVVLLPLFFLASLIVAFFKLYFETKEEERKDKIKEIKTEIFTALKQEKIIVEHNRDEVYCSRNVVIYEAKNNNIFNIENEKIDAQELLLKQPNIQRIVIRKTYYEFLKIHSKHQRLINKLCKEKESTKIIYEN